MNYYVHKEEQVWGPFSTGELKEMRAEERIAPTDLVAAEGTEDWQPLAEVFGVPPPPPPHPSAPPPRVTGPRLVVPAASQGVPSLSAHAARSAEAHLLENARSDHWAAYAAVFFVAGFNLLFGILDQVTEVEFVRLLGSGPFMLLFGALFAVLGIFVVLKSKAALIVALLLFVVDSVLLVYGFLEAGRFSIASIIFRVLVLGWMGSGLGAIDRVRSHEARIKLGL